MENVMEWMSRFAHMYRTHIYRWGELALRDKRHRRELRMGLVALLSAAPVIASAQSSVTMYGIVDNGVQYQTGLPSGTNFSAESGGYTQSEFGIKGSEDLGGGTKTIFRLETRIDSQNGTYTDGSFFGGNATVGLTNDSWGTFNLGYLGQYEIQQDSWDVDPQFMQEFAIATLVRGRNYSAAGNALEYTSPKLAGLTVKGQYDLSNSTIGRPPRPFGWCQGSIRWHEYRTPGDL